MIDANCYYSSYDIFDEIKRLEANKKKPQNEKTAEIITLGARGAVAAGMVPLLAYKRLKESMDEYIADG